MNFKFTINYRLEISPFYKNVLNKVSKIPFGATQSYKQIAKKSNNKTISTKPEDIEQMLAQIALAKRGSIWNEKDIDE